MGEAKIEEQPQRRMVEPKTGEQAQCCWVWGLGGSSADRQKWAGVWHSRETLGRKLVRLHPFLQGSGTGAVLVAQSRLTWDFLSSWGPHHLCLLS